MLPLLDDAPTSLEYTLTGATWGAGKCDLAGPHLPVPEKGCVWEEESQAHQGQMTKAFPRGEGAWGCLSPPLPQAKGQRLLFGEPLTFPCPVSFFLAIVLPLAQAKKT